MNFSKSFSFELPTEIVFGAGVCGKLTERLSQLNVGRILTVGDKGIDKSGLLDGIRNQLPEKGLDHKTFDSV